MTSTGFTIDALKRQAEPGVPYTERREGTEIYSIPYYEETSGVAPAGAIVSSINDMSRWLIAPSWASIERQSPSRHS